MTLLVAVGLYDRDRFSRGNAWRIFGYEAYHWGIIVMPQMSQGSDCSTIEATDASEIDPITFRMNNPTMDWWLRVKENIDPVLGGNLLGRVIIGQVQGGVSSAELQDVLRGVRLPVKNTNPQQSCVTWVVDTVRALQSQGWIQDFDLDQFKDVALSYADERMKKDDSKEPSVKHYSL